MAIWPKYGQLYANYFAANYIGIQVIRLAIL
jgi:hypothetical protein